MSVVTAEETRRFILDHLARAFAENGIAESQVGDDFDLMKMSIIDSIGLINLLSAVEDHFDIEIDFEDMDTDDITIIGPVCRYIAERARKRSA